MSTQHFDGEGGKCSCQSGPCVIVDPLRSGLHSHWKQNLFVDYVIQVENREFRVHKLIMSSMSDYFQAMLMGGMAETGKDHVVIEGVTVAVMETLINFMYTDCMNIHKDNAADILSGAVYFQINAAIKVATTFIVDNLEVGNWFDVLTLVRSYGLKDAIKDVQKYIKDNITRVITADNVVHLPYDDFCFLLDSWSDSEDSVFRFIQKWVKADLVERQKHYDSLLQHVRCCLMMPEELSAMKEKEPISAASSSWCCLVDKAMEYHKLPLHQRVLDVSTQSRVRNTPSFLTFSKEDSPNGGFFYGPDRMKVWPEHKLLKTPVTQGNAFLQIEVNNFLVVYTVGGEPFAEQWYLFDPRTVRWQKMAILERRCFGAILAHDYKYLYVVGGENYQSGNQGQSSPEVIDTIEQYDFQTDTWSSFSRLLVPLIAYRACILNAGLYISGGVPEGYNVPNLEEETLSRMDRLDLSTKMWESKAPMLQKRRAHSMHTMKLLGETVICSFDKSYHCEYYSPSDDQWSELSFCFDKPPPKITPRYWVRGNSLFFSDDDSEMIRMFGPQEYVCVVTFPEEGRVATVEYIPEINERFENATISTVLSIAPYTIGYQWLHYQI